MSRPVTFGVIGGYGGTGRAVVSHLWNSGQRDILVGGRDLSKANAVATEFDSRVTAVQVDALEPRSLDNFCSRCTVIINCAAPTVVVQDAVAQTALRNRFHYVDAGGFSFIKQRLLPRAAQIADSGLSFILSAGWVPGLTEVMPLYAYARALGRTIESVSMYFGDSSVWSTNALRDGVW
jgi:saccharopine dehydrogenase (NAD+, L-lysine-forming)